MATTPGAIRDRMATLITGITPRLHAGQKFLRHREQSPFRAAMDAVPGACLRRFSVRNLGDITQALVTDHQVERVEETMIVEVAYPTDGRHGGVELAGLDDAINSDATRIEATIGIPSSDATLKGLASIFRPADVERDFSEAVTYLTIRLRVEYARSLV